MYFNIKKEVFSIRDAKTNLVVVHGNHIRLEQQEDTSNQFAVNESGRERVLHEMQKNIHAFVIEEFEGIGEIDRPD